MRRLTAACALLGLAVLPPTTAAKEQDAPVRVLWNSTPAEVQAGGTWDARLSLLKGPGGFDPGRVRPTIVVTSLTNGAKRRVPMTVDVPPSTFKASVAFPHEGRYAVAVTDFDPRRPARRAALEAPVAIQAAGPDAADTWPWLLAAGIALTLLLSWRVYRYVNAANAASA